MSSIVLEHASYCPGDRIEGVGFIEIGFRVPKTISLSAIGRERTNWTGKERCFGSHKIFEGEIDVPPSQAGTTIMVPFSFVIPTGIPDSYRESGDGGNATASIEYSVEVTQDFSVDTMFDMITKKSLCCSKKDARKLHQTFFN